MEFAIDDEPVNERVRFDLLEQRSEGEPNLLTWRIDVGDRFGDRLVEAVAFPDQYLGVELFFRVENW